MSSMDLTEIRALVDEVGWDLYHNNPIVQRGLLREGVTAREALVAIVKALAAAHDALVQECGAMVRKDPE